MQMVWCLNSWLAVCYRHVCAKIQKTCICVYVYIYIYIYDSNDDNNDNNYNNN